MTRISKKTTSIKELNLRSNYEKARWTSVLFQDKKIILWVCEKFTTTSGRVNHHYLILKDDKIIDKVVLKRNFKPVDFYYSMKKYFDLQGQCKEDVMYPLSAKLIKKLLKSIGVTKVNPIDLTWE